MHTPSPVSRPRLRLRDSMRRAALRTWKPLVGVTLVTAVTTVPVTLVLGGYARGLVHGLMVASWIAGMFLVLLLSSGSTRWLAGAWGEENTRDELRRLRRRRVIVDWVDSVAVASGDVDHLVLTRGGAVAIDSKWHGSGTCGVEQWRRDAAAAAHAARRASLILRSEKCPLPVTPLVVVWGGAQAQVGRGWVVDGVRVLPGRSLQSWFADHAATEEFDAARAREIVTTLRRFRTRARAPQPGDRSIDQPGGRPDRVPAVGA